MIRNPLYENAVIIADRSSQKKFLDYRNAFPDASFSLLTKEEAEGLFLYQYDDRAVIELLKQGYGLSLSVDMLKAMTYFQKGKSYHSGKLNSLVPIFDSLLDSHLLFKPAFPERSFLGKSIIIVNVAKPDRLLALLTSIGVKKEDIHIEGKAFDPTHLPCLLEFDDIHQEVGYVCNRIANLLDSGTSPEDIYLADYSQSYRYEFEIFCGDYGFSIDFPSEKNLIDLSLGREFLKTYAESPDLAKTLSSLQAKFPDEKNFASLALLAARYEIPGWDKARQIDLYTKLLSKTKEKKNKLSNAVKILDEDCPVLGSHVFYLDFNLATSPRVYKDNDYLFDSEKEEIGMPTSITKNEEAKEQLKAFLTSEELECLSFKARQQNEAFHPSPLIGDLGLKTIQNKEEHYQYSRLYSDFLATHLADRQRKYRAKDERLDFLSHNLTRDVYTYNPQFCYYGGLDPDRERKYSYSSVDTYYKCPFHYYLNCVLHINDREISWRSKVGDLFHEVFSHMHEEGFDPDIAFNRAKEKMSKDPKYGPFSAREEVLLIRLKEECKKVVYFMKEKENLMYHASFSAEFDVAIELRDHVYLGGRIDKAIQVGPKENPCQYVVFVDYKTGSATFDESLLEHGLSLQLPLYSLLASQDPRYSDSEILGLFIQPAIPDKVVPSKNNTYEKEFLTNVKMDGVYLRDKDALSYLDSGLDYENKDTRSSSFIAGLALTKDGDFSKISDRGKSRQRFAEYGQIAKEKVLSADKAITSGLFPIEPKLAKGKVDSCAYCEYGDICYVRDYFRKAIRVSKKKKGGN